MDLDAFAEKLGFESQGVEAQFHRTIKKAQEGKKAISQYEADARAIGAKTAKFTPALVMRK